MAIKKYFKYLWLYNTTAYLEKLCVRKFSTNTSGHNKVENGDPNLFRRPPITPVLPKVSVWAFFGHKFFFQASLNSIGNTVLPILYG